MLHICDVKFTRGNDWDRRDMRPLVTLSDMLCSDSCWVDISLTRLYIWWLPIADISRAGFDMLTIVEAGVEGTV